MKNLWLISSAVLMLTACQAPVPTPETTTTVAQTTQEAIDPQTQTVTINVTVDGKAIEGSPFVLEIKAGENLLALMKDQLTIEEKDGFVSSINGVTQDKGDHVGKWWLFDVNGQMSEVGAAEVQLKSGDVIDWKLEAFNG